MGNVTGNQFKKGMVLDYSNGLWQIVEFQHVKPGKGSAFVRTKMKNIETGRVLEKNFKSEEKLEQADVETREMDYMYDDPDNSYFMDSKTYEQVEIENSVIENEKKFLFENMTVMVVVHNNKGLAVEMPNSIVTPITKCDPGVKGNSATNTTKPAYIGTGTCINVPLFINEGDKIRIDTRTGDYIERVNK